MGLLETIVGGGVGKLVKDVVGTFHLSPESKLEFDKELASRQFELQMKDRELEAKLAEYQAKEIEAASANIRAEATSGDKYTSRARPTFMYIVEIILAWNYIAVPLFNKTPVDLPTPLFWLFGSFGLGYVGARSWEKISGMMGGK